MGRPGYDLVVRSKRAILPAGEAPAAVAVLDGRIATVGRYDARLEGVREHDLGDVALLPGLVDTHVHAAQPGQDPRETFRVVTAAAAAGGVTTILDIPPWTSRDAALPDGAPPDGSFRPAAALRARRAAADGSCLVDVGFWGGAVPGGAISENLAGLRLLSEAGVFGFECFLAGHDAGSPPLDDRGLRAALAELASTANETLMTVHAEEGSEITPPSGPGYAAFLASRPPRAERRAIEKVVAAAASSNGARAHIAHLSAAECVALIAGAKAAGIALTAETCPHYLLLTAEEIPDGATWFKTCPPIRDAINREALWRGLEMGTIDCVVSGHWARAPAADRPGTPSDRAGGGEAGNGDAGDFGAAPSGISCIDLGLPAMWAAARRRGHGLPDVVRWMAERPAAIAGLAGKGRIASGFDADLVAFDPETEFTVRGSGLTRPGTETPYAGRTLAGTVRAAWLRGRPITAGQRPHGMLISRGAAGGGAAGGGAA
ncbi:MAG: allantoinase AllB [Micromonosporaceae bacterium]